MTSDQKYYQENKERIKTKNRAYILAHPEGDRIRHRKYVRTSKGKYNTFCGYAQRRNLIVGLDYDDFCSINSLPCFYCGGKLPETGCGLDRIDSSLGYLSNNVRPCCRICNQAKSDLQENEFRDWALMLCSHWAAKG